MRPVGMRMNKRWLIGRTIVDVELNPFSDGRGSIAHDPVITLDNGAKLAFQTEETDDLDYGVNIIYIPPTKKRKSP